MFLFGAATVGLATPHRPNATTGYGVYDTEAYSAGTHTADRSTEGHGGAEAAATDEPTVTRTPSRSGPQPVYETATNPISTSSLPLPAVTCALPEWDSTPRAARRYFKAALPCLNKAWSSVLRQAELPFEPPNLAFPRGGSWNSPCGSVSGSRAAAFYCGGNNTIYMPFRGLQTEQLGQQPVIYLAVLAHEYGHHVQDLTGIADAWAALAYESGGYDTPTGLELSRRFELQAQCFAGQFLASVESSGSISAAAAWNAIRNHYQRGDQPGKPRDHGSPAHYGGWMQQGYQHNDTATCNTWASPASEVS